LQAGGHRFEPGTLHGRSRPIIDTASTAPHVGLPSSRSDGAERPAIRQAFLMIQRRPDVRRTADPDALRAEAPMSHLRFARLLLPAAAVVAIACSDQSPTGPAGLSEDVTAARGGGAAAVPGIYTMSTRMTSEGLVLEARVQYASTGAPATGGEAKFYACRIGNAPAPSAACVSGAGRWSFEGTAGIIRTGPNAGFALLLFGQCPAGTTVGFYFRYSGQRTGVADGQSTPVDFSYAP
jgi:hypothetical protein